MKYRETWRFFFFWGRSEKCVCFTVCCGKKTILFIMKFLLQFSFTELIKITQECLASKVLVNGERFRFPKYKQKEGEPIAACSWTSTNLVSGQRMHWAIVWCGIVKESIQRSWVTVEGTMWNCYLHGDCWEQQAGIEAKWINLQYKQKKTWTVTVLLHPKVNLK